MNPENLQTSSLVFYPLPNFAGNPQPVAHGQSGIVASSSTDWSLQSVSVGDTITHAYIWSGVDTSNPGQSYTGHTESYVSASVRDLTATYPASQYPLQYLGLDNTLAVPVTVLAILWKLPARSPEENMVRQKCSGIRRSYLA